MPPLVEHVHGHQLFRVLRLQVDTTCLVMSESETADPTLKGPLTGMRPHVDNFVRGRPKRFVTHIALVRPLVTVHVQMLVQCGSH